MSRASYNLDSRHATAATSLAKQHLPLASDTATTTSLPTLALVCFAVLLAYCVLPSSRTNLTNRVEVVARPLRPPPLTSYAQFRSFQDSSL